MFRRLTPIYVVDRIEPCLEFWIGRFGFERKVAVPEGDHLGFVILARDGAEIMYQSRDSLRGDIPGLTDHPLEFSSIIHVDLESLDEVLPKLEGLEVVVPLRHTFHGGREIGVRGPSGRLILFAAPDPADGPPASPGSAGKTA